MSPHRFLSKPTEWCMTTKVVFPEFGPDRCIARDPEPELQHPFAFVESLGGAKGYFIRGWRDRDLGGMLLSELPNEEEVWARISKEDWDRALELFHGNDEDGDEAYHETIVEGVLANFEFQRVHVILDPMTERGELTVSIRFLDSI